MTPNISRPYTPTNPSPRSTITLANRLNSDRLRINISNMEISQGGTTPHALHSDPRTP